MFFRQILILSNGNLEWDLIKSKFRLKMKTIPQDPTYFSYEVLQKITTKKKKKKKTVKQGSV